jgi:hypothetical protein
VQENPAGHWREKNNKTEINLKILKHNKIIFVKETSTPKIRYNCATLGVRGRIIS